MYRKSILLAVAAVLLLGAADARAELSLKQLAPWEEDAFLLGGMEQPDAVERLPARQSFTILGALWQVYALTAAAIATGVTVGTGPATGEQLDTLQFRLNLVQGIPLGALELLFLAALCTDPQLEGKRLAQLPVLLMPAVMFLAGWLTSRYVSLKLNDGREAWPAWAGAAAGVAASTAVMFPLLALDGALQ